MTVLWASSQETFELWTNALKQLEPASRCKYPIRLRSEKNFFVASLYLCLKDKSERPAILS
jgi:hypothetical protein